MPLLVSVFRALRSKLGTVEFREGMLGCNEGKGLRLCKKIEIEASQAAVVEVQICPAVKRIVSDGLLTRRTGLRLSYT